MLLHGATGSVVSQRKCQYELKVHILHWVCECAAMAMSAFAVNAAVKQHKLTCVLNQLDLESDTDAKHTMESHGHALTVTQASQSKVCINSPSGLCINNPIKQLHNAMKLQ